MIAFKKEYITTQQAIDTINEAKRNGFYVTTLPLKDIGYNNLNGLKSDLVRLGCHCYMLQETMKVEWRTTKPV